MTAEAWPPAGPWAAGLGPNAGASDAAGPGPPAGRGPEAGRVRLLKSPSSSSSPGAFNYPENDLRELL